MRDVIIACDFADQEKLFKFLEPFKGLNPYLKLGMEIIYREGPQLVRKLKELGFKIFLDLKLHDIPNTVEKAMRNIATLGVEITNCQILDPLILKTYHFIKENIELKEINKVLIRICKNEI